MVVYIDYNLIILAIMSLITCILICVRVPGRSSKSVNHKQRKTELHRKLVKIPIPWGWPHHEEITFVGNHSIEAHSHIHSFSESLSNWTDRLVQEKHTVDDVAYMHKNEGCVRALLEDRYGRSGWVAPVPNAKPGNPFAEVSAPVYDQMDNVPSSRADKIEARLFKKADAGGSSMYLGQLKVENNIGLANLKMPWGW